MLVLVMPRLLTVSEILTMVELVTEARLERTRGARCSGGGLSQRRDWSVTQRRSAHSN